MANESSKSESIYVIQRTSETVCEWWTGTGWSENEDDALRYPTEPDVSLETLDESAKAQKIEPEEARVTGEDDFVGRA